MNGTRRGLLARLLAMRIVLLGLSVFLLGGVIWVCARAPIPPYGGSVVQRWYTGLQGKSYRVSLPGRHFWVSEHGGHLELGDRWTVPLGDRPFIIVSIGEKGSSTGLVSDCVEKQSWGIGVFAENGWPHSRTNEARAMALDAYVFDGDHLDVIEELRIRDSATRWHISIPMLLFDVVWLTALMLWPVSLVQVIKARRRRRRDRCLARGECPMCHYDISGLGATTCPECGVIWSPDEVSRSDDMVSSIA